MLLFTIYRQNLFIGRSAFCTTDFKYVPFNSTKVILFDGVNLMTFFVTYSLSDLVSLSSFWYIFTPLTEEFDPHVLRLLLVAAMTAMARVLDR